MYFQSSDIRVLWSSHHLLRLLASFSVIKGLAITALPWMLDMWSSCQTVFVEIKVSKMNTEFYCHLWCGSSMIFRHNPLQCTVPLSLSFGFWQPFLLAGDVFPWFVYAVITLETASVDAPNKVAILVTDAPAKHAPSVCPLQKSNKSPILQYFHTNYY